MNTYRTQDKMDICFWEEIDTGDYYESGCNKKDFSLTTEARMTMALSFALIVENNSK